MNKEQIGSFVMTERKKQGLSQKVLAEKAGITRYQQIIEIEKCQYDYGLNVLIKVLEALGFELLINNPSLVQQSSQFESPLTRGQLDTTPVSELISFDFSKVEAAKEEEPEIPKTFPGTKKVTTPFKRKK